MLQSCDVLFASSNQNKYKEAKKILASFGIRLGFFKCSLHEIQAESIKRVASQKVFDAYRLCKQPVIVEDDGLFIESLNGFPGPFSSYVFRTIGNEGVLRLVAGSKRQARFQSVIAYCDKKNGIILFDANVKGKISTKSTGRGWGYDPIFIPNGQKEGRRKQQQQQKPQRQRQEEEEEEEEERTYAVLSNKNEISHRYKALKKFSSWFVHMRESNGP